MLIVEPGIQPCPSLLVPASCRRSYVRCLDSHLPRQVSTTYNPSSQFLFLDWNLRISRHITNTILPCLSIRSPNTPKSCFQYTNCRRTYPSRSPPGPASNTAPPQPLLSPAAQQKKRPPRQLYSAFAPSLVGVKRYLSLKSDHRCEAKLGSVVSCQNVC
jgi:hypothetical protein